MSVDPRPGKGWILRACRRPTSENVGGPPGKGCILRAYRRPQGKGWRWACYPGRARSNACNRLEKYRGREVYLSFPFINHLYVNLSIYLWIYRSTISTNQSIANPNLLEDDLDEVCMEDPDLAAGSEADQRQADCRQLQLVNTDAKPSSGQWVTRSG